MSSASEVRAEAFRGSVERDGIALEFGRLAGAASETATTVQLTDGVLMSLETAQRLILALGDALQRPAPSAIAGEAPSPSPITMPSRGEIPVNAAADAAGEKAALLMRLVGQLGVPFQHERSFALSEGELHGNRFLLTITRDDLGEGPLERVLDVARALGMSAPIEREVAAHFDASRCIHFGFEARGASVLCKLYLERTFGPADVQRAAEAAEPFPLHLAFKWSTPEAPHVVSRYLWHPALEQDAIERRLGTIYAGAAEGTSLDIARAVLGLAASRTSAQGLQYLEVVEDGNDRRSFDLNLYPADLRVKDIQHLLSRMRAHYGIRPGQFQALLDQVKGRVLGHVAGGVHRDGRDFFTIYYGVEGYPRFSGVSG